LLAISGNGNWPSSRKTKNGHVNNPRLSGNQWKIQTLFRTKKTASKRL
jgi:hypothetical protein